MQSTEGEFECSKITGTRFETVGEHNCYLRKGGCSQLIEALADRNYLITQTGEYAESRLGL